MSRPAERPLPERAGAPLGLQALLAMYVGLSFIVVMEPAPTDLLFPLVLVVAICGGHTRGWARFSPLLIMSGLAFLATNLLPLLWCGNTAAGTRFMVITAYLLASFLLLSAIIARYGTPIVTLLLRAFGVAASISAGIGLLARFRLLPNSEMFFRDASAMRIKSTFKDPNVFGPFLVAATLVALATMVEQKRLRLRTLASMVLFGAAILLAFSRGAWAHLLLSIVVFVAAHMFVIRHPRALRRLATGGTAFLVLSVAAAMVLFATTDLGGYFVDRLSLQSYDQHRFTAQHQAIESAMSSPFGIGPGHFTKERFINATHNLYLRVLAENGVLGLLSFLLFAASALWCGVRGVLQRGPHANIHAACLAICVGIFGESLIIDTLHWRHLFLFLAIPVGLEAHESLVAPLPAPRPTARAAPEEVAA